jgi:RNA polymerase sigma-70 factor (ECF subfamily)
MLSAPRVTDRSADAPITSDALARFEAVMLPLLDDAYSLARYLTGDEHDTQDVVQESYLRALRYFDGFRGGPDPRAARAWLLTIVRNACRTWRRRRAPLADAEPYDESRHAVAAAAPDDDRREAAAAALGRLPAEFREALVLREVQGLAYKEIAHVLGVPLGTVMSRLARARRRMLALLRAAEAEP